MCKTALVQNAWKALEPVESLESPADFLTILSGNHSNVAELSGTMGQLSTLLTIELLCSLPVGTFRERGKPQSCNSPMTSYNMQKVRSC